MAPKLTKTSVWNLASVDLQDNYTDFLLSRQAMNCTPTTLDFYRHTAGAFLTWLEGQGITQPDQITARHVRAYLAGLIAKGRKDTTLHAHARAIRTLLRFWYGEKYIPAAIRFEMPKLTKKRLPVLTVAEVGKVVKACSVRDKAIVLLMVDSGLRRAEVCALNWSDVNIETGLIRVKQGKGRKDRSSVIGITTRRALLAYRRTLVNRDGPLFKTESGTRFSGNGLMMMFRRLSHKTGILITAHCLRRTFAILALRAGMDVLHLQNLGGWSSLDMVDHYAAMIDEDLLQAHKEHSPIDSLGRGEGDD